MGEISVFYCLTEAEDGRYSEWEASDVKIQNTTRLCHFALRGCEFTPRREKSTRKWDKVSRDQVGDDFSKRYEMKPFFWNAQASSIVSLRLPMEGTLSGKLRT